jgi:hypothetical protein
MAQNRFIGVNQDLTQEIFLLMTSTLSKSGVKKGLDTSIESAGFAGSFNIRIKAGLYVLPDGMIVQEDADTVFPFEVGSTTKATLYAYRSIDTSGYQSDVVRYDITPDFVTQQTIDKTSDRVYLPLAWIEKIDSLGTIDDYRIINLGEKTDSVQKSYRVPFSNLLSTESSLEWNTDPAAAKSSKLVPFVMQPVEVYNYYSGVVQKEIACKLVAGTYYLKLDPVPNHVLTNVILIAQNGQLNYSSYAGKNAAQNPLSGALNFTVADSSIWASQMIIYPQTKAVNWWLDGDTLQLDVLKTDPKNSSLNLPPVTLLEILATWKRVQ